MPIKFMRACFSFLLCLGLWGTGCAVGPHYRPPQTKGAASFSELNPTVNTNPPVADWWKTFHDPELDHLISEALSHNPDLEAASVRIRESRFQRNIAAADLFPTADATGSYTHARGSENVILPLGQNTGQSGSSSSSAQAKSSQRGRTDAPEFGANPKGASPSPFGQGGLPGATTDIYQVGFDASWEIDVFGGKRRTIEAAVAETEATIEGRRALQVSVAAETARDYLELRGSQERLRIARENLAAQNEVLTLTRSKRGAGLDSEFNVIRAASQTAATASTIPPLEANGRRLIHALSTLVGKEPNELNAELSAVKPLPATPPEIPIGLPSQLVNRRPDIRQAERAIAAATARIGGAQADLFPKFALIANAGLDSSSPDKLFNWESRYFLISPTVAWRIFDAGRVLANVALQRAATREATLQYQNSILKALREVEDALVTYATEHARRDHLTEELKQNRLALNLAKQRYDQGLSDFLNVLDAERSVFSAEDTVAISSLAISTDLVALYKSLGGGWN